VTPGDEVRLSVPPATAYVGPVRSLAAGLAARLDLDLDHVEDLRLAVSEACAVLLPLAAPHGRLDVTLRVVDAGLEVQLTTTTSAGDVLAEESFAWTVLHALADEVDHDVRDGVARLRLTFRPAPEAAGAGPG
jgi:serine/threonine-protein kinase RsbW